MIFQLTSSSENIPSDAPDENNTPLLSERIDVDCWYQISGFLSFEDIRSSLSVEGLHRSDAHSFLNKRIKESRLETVLLQACEFLSIADIGNCVLSFARDNVKLALKLSQKSDMLRRRPRLRRSPPAACPCCFPREY